MSCCECNKNGKCTGCSGKDALKAAVNKKEEIEKNPLKKRIIKTGIALFLFIAVFVIDRIFNLSGINKGPECWVLPFVCYFVVYLIAGMSVLKEAAEEIKEGHILDENILMTIASLGAFALGIYTGCTTGICDGYAEGCAVMVFYQIGELFQDWAVGNSKKNISELMDLRPTIVHACDLNFNFLNDEEPEKVMPGDILMVKKGEKVPLDGTLLKGKAVLNLASLNGESALKIVEDDKTRILSGSVNVGENIFIKADAEYENSTVAKILNLVENASEKKTDTEKFITKFSRIYTPCVVALAVIIAVVIPLAGGGGHLWRIWIERALNFLVVSCPCALVLSVPLSYFMAIGTAGKNQVLIKGSKYIERMVKPEIMICDKTGTLTVGKNRIKEFEEKGDLNSLSENNDPLKAETPEVIRTLRRDGCRVIMLSGDKKSEAGAVASAAGIDEYKYELLPQEKVEEVEKIMKEKASESVLVYVGDGINDAPSLMRADVGIAMGAIGTDAAMEAADIVLMNDDLRGILFMKKLAVKTMRIVKENVWVSILIKIAILILCACGIADMWFAVFADVGVTVLAMLNSLRIGISSKNK